MTRAEAVSAIQTLLTPALMVNACGLLLLSMLNRYGRVNDRLRKLSRERIDLLPQRGQGSADLQLKTIDRQLPELLRRNGLLRNSILSLFLAVICFVAVIFCIALSFWGMSELGAYLSVGVFLAGQALVFAGMVLIALEIRVSHAAVSYETLEILKLS